MRNVTHTCPHMPLAMLMCAELAEAACCCCGGIALVQISLRRHCTARHGMALASHGTALASCNEKKPVVKKPVVMKSLFSPKSRTTIHPPTRSPAHCSSYLFLSSPQQHHAIQMGFSPGFESCWTSTSSWRRKAHTCSVLVVGGPERFASPKN